MDVSDSDGSDNFNGTRSTGTSTGGGKCDVRCVCACDIDACTQVGFQVPANGQDREETGRGLTAEEKTRGFSYSSRQLALYSITVLFRFMALNLVLLILLSHNSPVVQLFSWQDAFY